MDFYREAVALISGQPLFIVQEASFPVRSSRTHGRLGARF